MNLTDLCGKRLNKKETVTLIEVLTTPIILLNILPYVACFLYYVQRTFIILCYALNKRRCFTIVLLHNSV